MVNTGRVGLRDEHLDVGQAKPGYRYCRYGVRWVAVVRQADDVASAVWGAIAAGLRHTSVLLDIGSSLTEAALLLRHSDKKTTERLDALWLAWVGAFPNVIAKLGMDGDNVVELEARRRWN